MQQKVQWETNKMKVWFTWLILSVTAALAIGDETDLQKLAPKNAKDRAVLLEIVTQATKGKCNQAAKILAKAGYMDDLLDILMITENYNTMQAIAQTKDERTIPIFESRLRCKPSSRYLVGSLAYVRSPKASPILISLLKQHADSSQPSQYDMVGCLLNAMLFNRCQDAIPILRERFERCETTTQADRKSHYALTLLALGDPIGISWLSKRLHEDIESRAFSSKTANQMATICEWMPPRSNLVVIQDEAVMTPLLHELVRGASSPKHPLADECCRILRVLTRHDFPDGDSAWRKWYSKQADKHPIYTKPLERAINLCGDTFRNGLADAANKNKKLTWLSYCLSASLYNAGAHSSPLLKLYSSPGSHTALITSLSPQEKEKLNLQFTVSFTSEFVKPDNLLFKKDFSSINISVCLASSVEDEKSQQELIELASHACKILSAYEDFYQKTKPAGEELKNPGPNGTLDAL